MLLFVGCNVKIFRLIFRMFRKPRGERCYCSKRSLVGGRPHPRPPLQGWRGGFQRFPSPYLGKGQGHGGSSRTDTRRCNSMSR